MRGEVFECWGIELLEIVYLYGGVVVGINDFKEGEKYFRISDDW
jgi:hypothetical protein